MKARNVFLWIVCCLLLLPVLPASSQSFTRITLIRDILWSEGGNWIDYDLDGDLDLFIPNNPRRSTVNSLYLNEGDGTFDRITSGILVEDDVMSESGTWGDFDNDGDPDLFVADGGFDSMRVNSMYVNLGSGNFEEVAPSVVTTELSFSTASSWADFDNDGYLDLFVSSHSGANTPGVPGPDFLYRNKGDGTFSKVSGQPVSVTPTTSFGAGWSDFDLDGDVDLFVTNGGPNKLYRNDGDGDFTDINAGAPTSEGGSIAPSWGDFNNDGYPDLFVANFGKNDFLYTNNGDGTFTKVTGTPVEGNAGMGEGSGWSDYDNDGDLDLLVANGGANLDLIYLYENQLIETGQAVFVEVAAGDMVTTLGCYAGIAWGDYDNDGDQDVFVSSFSGKSSIVFRNETTGNNWINIEAKGTVSNRSAIGARIGVKAFISGADRWQWREISGQTGYNGQNSLRAHFGLGDATMADSVLIFWPSGIIDSLGALNANGFFVVNEDETNVGMDDIVRAREFFHVLEAYPIPATGELTIKVHLDTNADFKISLFDVTGRRVDTSSLRARGRGEAEAVFDVTDLPSGVYIARVSTLSRSSSTLVVVAR